MSATRPPQRSEWAPPPAPRQLTDSESAGDRDKCYQAFVLQCADGIWRLNLQSPVSIDQPEDAIIDALYAHAILAECNTSFARQNGVERPDTLISGKLNEFLVRDDPASDALLRAFVRGGCHAVDLETSVVRTDSELRIFANELIGVVDARRLIHIWGVRRDVTAAKQAEADLRRAKESAEAASRAKSAFLANVSHEIRTPLNGVLGMAHLVLQDELSPAQRERLRVLKTSADSLLHVLNDLLDFSKMEAGKFQLSLIPFCLADELGEMMKWLALRAHEKGLQLSFYLEPDVPTVVVADPARLRQVLVNLVGNAIKFTERGEITLRVGISKNQNACSTDELGLNGSDRHELATTDPPESDDLCKSLGNSCGFLEFVVQDTGIGIAVSKLTRIFEPFEQGDAAIAGRYGGTGLGLAIVKRLAALMGGAVTAESEPGRGSTFRFTARFETIGGPKVRPALPPRVTELQVLAVDPHPLSRCLLVEQLTAWGMEATGAADSAAATELARNAGKPFELLILDGGAAVTDTLETLRHLRESGVARSAIVCIPPASWTDPALAGVSPSGAGFLAKPFKPTELLDAMISVLKLTPPAWLASRRGDTVPVAAPAALRVLLAEDNVVNQAVAVGMLQSAGHTVHVVNSGRGVLAALAAEPFDVVLMDVRMPDMDGFEATAAIRAAEADAGRHMPIIALTAGAMTGDREECLRRGMDDFVAKPIQPQELNQVLSRLRPLPAGPLFARRAAPLECSTGADEVFDADEFRSRCGGRNDLVRRIARLFLSECPRYLDRLQNALVAGDPEAFRMAAHTLKGALANLSAGAAFASAAQLERMGCAGNLSEAPGRLISLNAEVDRLRLALRGLLGGPSAGVSSFSAKP